MANRISIYEELQVEKYLYDLYLLWGRNLEESMCISEGWDCVSRWKRKISV